MVPGTGECLGLCYLCSGSDSASGGRSVTRSPVCFFMEMLIECLHGAGCWVGTGEGRGCLPWWWRWARARDMLLEAERV